MKNIIKRGVFAAAAIALAVCFSVSAAAAPAEVMLGGEVFGVRFDTGSVCVTELADVKTDAGSVCPARDAGIEVGDIIIRVNGADVKSSLTVTEAIEKSNGGEVTLTVKRNGSDVDINMTPIKDSGGIYRAGMWIRDSAAGIGTVTFYDEKTGVFAGLGHGICDAETGELIPFSHGTVTDVNLCGITKGEAGVPGELKGYFGINHTGEILSNTETGVYGIINSIPSQEKIELADADDVHSGDVTIRCTLSGGDAKCYKATISDINVDGKGKSFVISITDPELKSLSGGIVQGMSGSPVIQDGKLIGAVTHVMINNPCRGYGIFIGEMTANMP